MMSTPRIVRLGLSHPRERGPCSWASRPCGSWTTNIAIHPEHPNEIFITESQTGTVLKATLPMY